MSNTSTNQEKKVYFEDYHYNYDKLDLEIENKSILLLIT
jgi:hypothetical protein